jgi:hypothetical protein
MPLRLAPRSLPISACRQARDALTEAAGYLGGKAPWGYRVGNAGELVPIPEQQAATPGTDRPAQRAIAEKMKAAGVVPSLSPSVRTPILPT